MSNPLTCLVPGFGSTIPASSIDYLIGQNPVDPAAGVALRTLYDDLGLHPGETLPNDAFLIRHVRDFRALLHTMRDQPWLHL